MTSYTVRLSMGVPADNPQDAVKAWMSQATRNGLQNYYYRVEDEDSGDVWMVSLNPLNPVMMTFQEFAELYRYELNEGGEEPSLEELLFGEAGMPADYDPVAPVNDTQATDDDAKQAEAVVAQRMAARKARHNGRAH